MLINILVGILLTILALCALLLFVPIYYTAHAYRKEEDMKVNVRAHFLYPLILFTAYYEQGFITKLRILGIPLKIPKKKEKKPKTNKQPEINLQQTFSAPKTEVLEEAATSVPQEAETPRKAPVLDQIIGYYQLYDQNKDLVLGLCKKIIKELRKLKPKTLRISLQLGTGSADTTAYIIAITQVIEQYLPCQLTLEPDWLESRYDGTVLLKGKLRVFTILIIGLKLYKDEQCQKLISNLGGRKRE